MRILIVGAGPAGLAFACSLRARGIHATIIEHRARGDSQGHAVGLHGSGWRVAERLGLLAELAEQAFPLHLANYYSARGGYLYSYDYGPALKAAGNRMIALPRDALQHTLIERLRPEIRVKFGVGLVELRQDKEAVRAILSDGQVQSYDLVVGADGYRSRVRTIAFGEEHDFMRPLGLRAAAWLTELKRPLAASYVGLIDVGAQAGVYAMRGATAATLFCWRDTGNERIHRDVRRRMLAERFGAWASPVSDVLAHEPDWQRGYCDQIVQVEVPRWSTGRVVLLGDAAWCSSFFSGQGTSVAFAGAYVLAQELTARPTADALLHYEKRLRPYIATVQMRSRDFARHVVPCSRLDMYLRAWSGPLMRLPFIGRVAAKRMVGPEFDLGVEYPGT